MSKVVTKASSAKGVHASTTPAVLVDDRAVLRDLGVELFALVFDFLGEMKLSKRECKNFVAEAVAQKKRVLHSKAITPRSLQVANMLGVWRRDKHYTAPDGAPKVIPIHGKGRTFESLAKKYVPNTSVEEVLKIACNQGDVQRRKDDMVALLGSSVILQNQTRKESLAAFITRVRALASNYIHNLELPNNAGSGYLERRVSVRTSRKRFDPVAQELRPELVNICDHADVRLQQNASRNPSANDVRAGLIMFLFCEEGPLYPNSTGGRQLSAPRPRRRAAAVR